MSYVSGTEYRNELADQYVWSKILLLLVTTPTGKRIKYHPYTDDTVTFVERLKPELAIFIHLGVVIIGRVPESKAESVERATWIRTIATVDMMTLDVRKELVIGDTKTHEPGWIRTLHHDVTRWNSVLSQNVIDPKLVYDV